MSITFLLRCYKSIKLTKQKRNYTIKKAINKSITITQYKQSGYIIIPRGNKGRE